MTDDTPQAIAESEMIVLGHKIRVHVLSDGKRVIEAGDMERLLQALTAPTGEDDDAEICETCDRKLKEGDLIHRCADGPILCEECAPTWADILTQYKDETDGDFGAFVDRTPEEMAEDRAAAQARVDAGDGDKKHVWRL